MKRRSLTRMELYELVWSEPMSKLAPGFCMSDVGLRKICVRQHIPVPPRGYWQKLARGQKPKRPPLTKPNNNPTLEFAVRDDPTEFEGELMDGVFAPLIAAEALPKNRIVVATELAAPHPMTKQAQKVLGRARADSYGGLLCEDPNVFRIRVPPASIDRALLLIDAIAKALGDRGLAIQPGDGGHYTASAGIVVGDGVERISIEETSRRQVHKSSEAEKAQTRRQGYSSAPLYDFQPSGNITIKLEGGWRSEGFQTSWRDTSKQRVEERLNEVIVSLYRAAHARAVARAKEAERKRRIDDENARRAALRAERDQAIAFGETLEQNAQAWDHAQRLRAYIAAVQRNAEAKGLTDEVDPVAGAGPASRGPA